MAGTPPPPAEQTVLPDAQVAADEPTFGEWFVFNSDELSDPSGDKIRSTVFANSSCFKEKKKEVNTCSSLGVFSNVPRPGSPSPREIISWENKHCPQEFGFSDSDLLSLRIKFNEMFDEITDIGQGKFGSVFQARNKQDNKPYAIKRIMEKLEDDEKRKKIMEEVDIWKSLGTHENIVEMINHWIEGNNLYIQMELCESCLSEKKKHFDYGETKKLLYQLSNVLEFIHGRCIAHLDVKPANIYLSNGVYKIGDFGCAASTCSEQRIEGGDDRYMPDEMLNGSYNDLRKVDVFSLGASCYELITGDDVNPRAGDLDLPSEFPEEFGYLIKSMRHPDPEERPSLEAILKEPIFNEFRKDVSK